MGVLKNHWPVLQRFLFVILTMVVTPFGARAATYHVSVQGNNADAGTEAKPWRTIQHAVDSLKPGDTAIVGAGVYRERIEVKRGGTAKAPISLIAAPGARVIVSGADLLSDGWTNEKGSDGIYSHDWAHRFPINGPNDLIHPADKYHEVIGRAEQVMHEGRQLRQVLRREQVSHGTFYVDLGAKKLYVWLGNSMDPARTEVEASTRTQWLTGVRDVSFVYVRGITFRYAANHAQRGAFSVPYGSRGWQVVDCVFERTNGVAVTITGDGHLFRRCIFQDNGQMGLGAYACHNTRIEECSFYRNNLKGYNLDWEAGGVKITMSRGFVFWRCRAVDNRGPGLWYDIGNEKAVIAHCYIADNDEAGIFYEISYSLHAHDNLIVNNANHKAKPRGSWGVGGITLSSSEDCIVENNTLIGNRDGFTLREQNRTTPRIDGGERRIMNKNHIIRKNLIAHSQEFNIGFWIDMTFFGPHPAGHDKKDPISEDPKTLNLRFEENLLWALPGRPNYQYGCVWRPKSKSADTPADFTKVSGIADTSIVADPRFTDIHARDYRLLAESPASKRGLGLREFEKIPQR